MDPVLLAVLLDASQQKAATNIACHPPTPCPCPSNVFFLFQINMKLVVLVSRARIWKVVGVVILSNLWESFWMF